MVCYVSQYDRVPFFSLAQLRDISKMEIAGKWMRI
jgi:hypothetical protein